MKLSNLFNKPKKRDTKKTMQDSRQEEVGVKKVETISTPNPKARIKKGSVQNQLLLRSPHISEKSTDLAQINQYVFNVAPEANAVSIKQIVEGVYGVDVLDVRMINVPRKPRRMGRHKGWRKGYKKAIVRIKEGQTIEVLPR